MSTDTERVEDGTETSVLESFRDWYHLPVIGAVMLFMVWLRTQSYDRFVTEDGTPALAGVDSWYHWRTINWTAENYPHTMPYEVWTGFPSGNYVGQFGTLFDQLIVTVAMIVGLGDPSAETLYTVSLLSIPVMAALVAIPVFYAGRRLGGTLGGVVSVLVLALAKGQFLSRSTVGQLDHHVGEVLFMAIAILAMMVALTVAEREKPIYELVVDRDWDALRRPAIYSGLAGLALTLYIWVWPSAILLIGIFAIFFTVQLCLDYLRGVSPDHVAFVGAVSLGVTALLTILLMEQPGSTGSTSFGLLQPLTAFLVAAGCVFMAWLAREWNNRGLERQYYPVAIGGLIAATFVVMWLAVPSLFDSIIGNATRRMLPFGGTATDLTIAEAQPPENFFDRVFTEFGSAFYTMLAGLAFLAIRPLLGRKFRAEHTLVIVWALFLISMAATQVRFMYYLTLAVAVVNAAFVAEITRLFDLDLENSLDSIRQVETYQVIVVLLVVLLLLHRSCHRSRRRLRGIRANRPVRAGARRTGKNRTTGSKRTRLRRGTTAARTTPTNSTTTERTIRVTATTSIRRGLRRHVVVGLRPPDNDPGRTDSALEPVPAKRAVVVNVPDRRVRGTGGTGSRRDRRGRAGCRSLH